MIEKQYEAPAADVVLFEEGDYAYTQETSAGVVKNDGEMESIPVVQGDPTKPGVHF